MTRQRREPNPFNARAARVAGALSDYAAAAGRSPASLTRSEIRAALKERGLYTSEGSLSRDLAAIRKTIDDFGGARTAWATTNKVEVDIDGIDRYAVKLMTAPDTAWRGTISVGAVVGDRLFRISVLATGDAGADRARAVSLLLSKIEREREKRRRRARRASYQSKCEICQANEPDTYHPEYGAVCFECLDRLEAERNEEEADDYSDLRSISWDDDLSDAEIYVFADRRSRWMRGGRSWRDS